MDKIIMPAHMIPGFNVTKALERGVGNNFLIKTWGGLGDQVCAEPTLRYSFKAFQHCKISLASEHPELFDHLPFLKVYDLKKEKPDFDKYMVFDTIVDPSHLLWQFASHCLVNCVDFPSICAFRMQLPITEREVILHGKKPSFEMASNYVVVHPGKHWPSKTFPKSWWDDVISKLKEKYTVYIIGKDTSDNRSTVDVSVDGCVDLRNKTNLKELIWILQNATVVITNDSSPLHIAASGKAHIGYIASCKHPDYISHWRNGQWCWRMKNLGLDGIWNYIDHSPVQKNEVSVEFLPDGVMEKLLPTSDSVLEYVSECFRIGV